MSCSACQQLPVIHFGQACWLPVTPGYVETKAEGENQMDVDFYILLLNVSWWNQRGKKRVDIKGEGGGDRKNYPMLIDVNFPSGTSFDTNKPDGLLNRWPIWGFGS